MKLDFKKFAAHFTVVLLFISGLSAISVSPARAATCTGAFPADSLWQPVRNTTGGLLTDPNADVGSGSDNTNVDIYGTEATATSPAGSAIDWYSTGSSGCFQFRMRIKASAISGSRIDNKEWIVGLGTASTTKAWMVVNGNNSDPNTVWIYDGTPTLKFTYNFNGAGSNTTYAFATSVGSGASIRYYVYWQVPYADLISVLGATSIYGFFAGTSQANSFSSINRDCLSANCSSPTYTSTQKVDLSQDVSTIVNPPEITSLSVTKGTTSGNTSTVITGTNLTNTVRVLFGNTAATISSFTSTSVTVTTPAGSVGDVNIQVETAAGGLSNVLQNAYKYITAPTVTSVAATGLSSTTAQLNGTISAGNDATTTGFCYGTSNTLSGCTSVSTNTLTGTNSTPAPSPSAAPSPSPSPSASTSTNGNSNNSNTPNPNSSKSPEPVSSPSPEPSSAPTSAATIEPSPTPTTNGNSSNTNTPNANSSKSPEPSSSPSPISSPSPTTSTSPKPSSSPSPNTNGNSGNTNSPNASSSRTPTPSSTSRPSTSSPAPTSAATPRPSATSTSSSTTPAPTTSTTPTLAPTPSATPATLADVKRPVGEGIARVTVSGTSVAITAQRNFSGITSAAVTVRDKGQTATVVVPVTVLPNPVTAPASVPISLNQSVISWKSSPNASSYEVKVNGQVVCQTSAASCTAPVIVGPKTPVEITAIGGDNLKAVVPSTYQPNKPVPAITVNFKSGSSVLSTAQKAELTKIANVIKNEGFIRLVVTGHTDTQPGMDNQKLSEARAKATAAFLVKLVPTVDFVVKGYAAKDPVAGNDTAAGMAANRRAELSLW